MNSSMPTSHPVRHTSACIGLLLALCVAAPTPAQELSRRGEARPKLVLEAGDHSIKDLIDRAARYLKRNYLYRKDEVTQAEGIHLQTGVALSPDDCKDFISQIVYAQGFILIPVSRPLKTYQVISLRGQQRGRIASGATAMTPEQVKKIATRYVVVTTNFSLKHIDAQRASAQLRPFFAASTGSGMPLQFAGLTKNSLLISGLAPHVARAIGLIEMADTATPVQESPARSRVQKPKTKASK